MALNSGYNKWNVLCDDSLSPMRKFFKFLVLFLQKEWFLFVAIFVIALLFLIFEMFE
jgi:hypothetical protein